MVTKRNAIFTGLLVAIVGLVVAIVFLVMDNQNKQAQLDAANQASTNVDVIDRPVHETTPSDGSNPADTTSPAVPATMEFVSEKGVSVRLYDWTASKTIASPVTISGEIPGNWSFEASFPAILVDWDGRIIAEQPATLQADWMTEDHVPFTVTMTFDTPSVYKNGSLILRKDNPSGLPENDDAIEIPVTFG